MITAWRICKQKHAATAFDGFGARRDGGRWNSPGTAMVYTAAVASQALLELLVHADASLLSLSYVVIPVSFDARHVDDLDKTSLARNWQENQAVTRSIGDAWSRDARSLVLRVPSVVLHTDPNYLINPRHRNVRSLRIGDPQPLLIDSRLKAMFSR